MNSWTPITAVRADLYPRCASLVDLPPDAIIRPGDDFWSRGDACDE